MPLSRSLRSRRPVKAADEVHHFVEAWRPTLFECPRGSALSTVSAGYGEARINATTDRPSVILFAPPLVAPGREFAVNVLLSAPADVYGWVDITFDPAALTPGAVSVEHERPSANVVASKSMEGRRPISRRAHSRANAHGLLIFRSALLDYLSSRVEHLGWDCY